MLFTLLTLLLTKLAIKTLGTSSYKDGKFVVEENFCEWTQVGWERGNKNYEPIKVETWPLYFVSRECDFVFQVAFAIHLQECEDMVPVRIVIPSRVRKV